MYAYNVSMIDTNFYCRESFENVFVDTARVKSDENTTEQGTQKPTQYNS